MHVLFFTTGKFEAHAARVKSAAQVKQFVDTLLSDRKIAVATHNIYAFRIARPGTTSYVGFTINTRFYCNIG